MHSRTRTGKVIKVPKPIKISGSQNCGHFPAKRKRKNSYHDDNPNQVTFAAMRDGDIRPLPWGKFVVVWEIFGLSGASLNSGAMMNLEC